MSELIVNKKANSVELCVLEDNSVCELYTYDKENENIVGNIYVGTIKNVVDGMQAAFIDIGLKKNAFISLKDAVPKVDVTKEEQVVDFKISSVLSENEKILVQVKKMPTAEKGARVSTHITIPGDYIVIMPNTSIVTISQKIYQNAEKERLLNLVKSLLPEGFGAIVRTDAENISDDKIKADIQELVEKWSTIMIDYQQSKEVTLLYDEHELISKIGRELVTQRLDKIYTNNKQIFEGVQSYISKKSFLKQIDMELLNSDIIKKFGLENQVLNANNKKIWLKCGGYIVIDKTEALTAVDVNSGKYVGNSNLEETALIVNKEAAYEIMKQVRLRDISGIVVVDYIDLQKKDDQAEIVKIMENEAVKDRSKIDIKGYTKLNLVEFTRKMTNI
ncbi:MAG: Rne/Rng family ribonuclease [Clostridia bacterium]|nr:Rne/Rng family ribonuclease [Clostridia bacterium]